MKYPTYIVLVRHGTTPTTGKELPGRKPGLYLSEAGIKEARAAGEIIKEAFPKSVAVIYSSPLERARQTADEIAAKLSTKVVTEDNLLECDFGRFTGRKLNDLYKIKAWSQLHRNPGGFRFPQGESFVEMETRMKAFLESCLKTHSGKTVVLVSHADPIKVLINFALGLHINNFQRLVISPASVSVLSYEDRLAPGRLLALNLKSSLKESISA
jgi:probable phosphoglycerate mutase